jgi:hypothetical protein
MDGTLRSLMRLFVRTELKRFMGYNLLNWAMLTSLYKVAFACLADTTQYIIDYDYMVLL